MIMGKNLVEKYMDEGSTMKRNIDMVGFGLEASKISLGVKIDAIIKSHKLNIMELKKMKSKLKCITSNMELVRMEGWIDKISG